jgi:hypothetical protein
MGLKALSLLLRQYNKYFVRPLENLLIQILHGLLTRRLLFVKTEIQFHSNQHGR